MWQDLVSVEAVAAAGKRPAPVTVPVVLSLYTVGPRLPQYSSCSWKSAYKQKEVLNDINVVWYRVHSSHWRTQDLKKGGVVVEGDHQKGEGAGGGCVPSGAKRGSF